MDYRVKLDIFDGPFDLLLYLIKVNEMDIYDISISEITRQYLDYIQLLQELNLEVAGEFLVMAATLIRLKARQLLPTSTESETEEEIDDILSTKQLIHQLIEYRRIKEMAGELKERQSEFSRVFYRSEKPAVVTESAEDQSRERQQLQVDLQTLFYAFSRVLPYVETSTITHLAPERYTVEEKINFIKDLLQSTQNIDFKELLRDCADKEELIVTFLALMELCRKQEIRIIQKRLFGDIYITSNIPASSP
ncbi:segregation/condensation protein A [Candidatus Sumerlaeota bacterium]|nr:segregation/condensation protein A [Candidatus Sumerlaeota bacterium]